jgi:hypothetical protein
VASSRLPLDRPKSSLTERSAAEPDDDEAPPGRWDSDVDLPRNSHCEVRAKPCCGSLDVSAWSGAVPKTCCVK